MQPTCSVWPFLVADRMPRLPRSSKPVSASRTRLMASRSASGERGRHPSFDGDESVAILNTRRAGSGVQKPVVQGVVRTPVVLQARCAGVVRTLVVLQARCGQPDRVLGVVQMNARCAARDRVLSVIPTERPSCRCGSMPVWSAHAGGTRTWQTGAPNTPLQPTASRARSCLF
jgi:hypothetical protein